MRPTVEARGSTRRCGPALPEVRAWVETELAAHAHQVPDALRAAFAAKISRRLTPAIRATGPSGETSPASSQAELAALLAEAELVALADDATAVGAFAGKPPPEVERAPSLASTWTRVRLLAAARLDAAQPAAQLDELVRGHAGLQERTEALARYTAFVSLVDAEGPLPYGIYRRLFQRQCSPAARAAALAVVDDQLAGLEHDLAASAVRSAIDACIAERATLEPVFRAWLAPTRSSRPRPAR